MLNIFIQLLALMDLYRYLDRFTTQLVFSFNVIKYISKRLNFLWEVEIYARKKPKNNLHMALNVYDYQLMETGWRGHSLLGRECSCARVKVLCVRNIFEFGYTKK
jgi:hypothetical protein